MSLFFITFFFLYSGMHCYVFMKAWQAFHFSWALGMLLGVFFLIMIIAPILVRILERERQDSLARYVARVGYSWLGLLFLFFSISIFIDFVLFLAYITGSLWHIDYSSAISAHKLIFLIPLAASILIASYGYREAANIRHHTLRIYTPKISKETGRFTIAQISDVHLGLLVGEERLNKIVQLVEKANPDILVCTGDLVDGDLDKVNGLVDVLKGVEPKYGKFAITGNHEFIAGIEKSLDFIKKTGFTMLRGEALTVGGVVNITGVDDAAGKPFNYRYVSEKALLSSLPPELFTLLLKHRPVIDEDALSFFDLQLSGHTHKGQIYPFRYLTRLFFPLYTGYHKLANNAHLYVTNGSGTWGPPIRFLAPPEVAIIELIAQ